MLGKSILKMKNKPKCSICESDLDEQGVIGEFGMLPVSFCVWCMSSMTDMVIQMNEFDDIEILEERIAYLKEND